MDFSALVQAVTSLGFPVVCCGAVMWYVKYLTDANRAEIDDINMQHREEMQQITQAVQNNTEALIRLTEKLTAAGDDMK
jgi:hypothetical protein